MRFAHKGEAGLRVLIVARRLTLPGSRLFCLRGTVFSKQLGRHIMKHAITATLALAALMLPAAAQTPTQNPAPGAVKR
jgi:hypothetical protein